MGSAGGMLKNKWGELRKEGKWGGEILSVQVEAP